MLLSFFLPGLIPLWLLIGGILLFSNVFADPSSVAESRPPSAVATNPSGPRDNTENGVPRTSRLAWLCAMVGLALLIGGVSLAILDDVIQQELLTLSPTEMVVILVCLAAGAIPGLIGLMLSGTAWRRCGQRHLGGRGLAAAALLMSTLYLAGLGQTFHRSHQSMVRWRAIEQLASQQDPSTLDALETEVVHPASRGTRQRAARLLANHAPERALSLIRHGSVASCRALLESLQDSQHQKFASAARHVYKKRISGPASELLSSRGWPPLERQSSDHHKPAAFRR